MRRKDVTDVNAEGEELTRRFRLPAAGSEVSMSGLGEEARHPSSLNTQTNP